MLTRIFISSLKQNLKSKIKGDINCHIVNDTLIVDIRILHIPPYRYTRNFITEEIVQGLTGKMLSELIIKEYQILINKIFFK